MKKQSVSSTDLVCLECGNVFTIMRKTRKMRQYSHIKHLWCYKCKKVNPHYEVRDIDMFMWKETSNEIELLVKDLVRNGKENSAFERNNVLKKVLKR